MLRSAEHASRIARLSEKEISRIPGLNFVWKVQRNGVFVHLPRHSIEKIKQHTFSVCRGPEGVTDVARPRGYRLLFAALLTKLSALSRRVSIQPKSLDPRSRG